MQREDLEAIISDLRDNNGFERRVRLQKPLRISATDPTWSEAQQLATTIGDREVTIDYSPALDHDRAGLLRVRNGGREYFSRVVDPLSAQLNGSGAYVSVQVGNDLLRLYVR